LVNTTYMGRHEYGKRSKDPNRQLIVRTIAAIVSEDTWQKAQKTLSDNLLFGKRNSRHQYLLRGLCKCGLCGLGTGNAVPLKRPTVTSWSGARHTFQQAHPCPSRGLTAGHCPGYVVDHIVPLKRGGADSPENMQWQSAAEAKAKDRVE
jgi:hypothetical protein